LRNAIISRRVSLSGIVESFSVALRQRIACKARRFPRVKLPKPNGLSASALAKRHRSIPESRASSRTLKPSAFLQPESVRLGFMTRLLSAIRRCVYKFIVIIIRGDIKTVMKTIGERIAARRKERDMTQGELATLCEVEGNTVSRWERGIVVPEDTRIRMIASALKVKEEWLRGVQTDVIENPDSTQAYLHFQAELQKLKIGHQNLQREIECINDPAGFMQKMRNHFSEQLKDWPSSLAPFAALAMKLELLNKTGLTEAAKALESIASSSDFTKACAAIDKIYSDSSMKR
jgi:transcriptional regulator with XRE-family HTH domain